MGRLQWCKAARLPLLLSILSLGCQRVYRSETIWLADGSVDRAIYQESNATPEPVRRKEVWKQSTYALDPDKMEREGWTGPISKLPLHAPDGDHPYFAAWGRFKSPADMPDHLLFKPPDGLGLPDGTLVRDCRRTDYVFVQEYIWRETLTDLVRLDDMRQARDQLADLLIDVWQDGFNQAFGQEYDGTDLVKLMRREGKKWFAELTDFAFVHCATRKGPAAQGALWDGLARICAGHGLPLKVQGKLLSGEEQRRAVEDFAIGKLCRYVHRKRDGRPLDKKTATAWLAVPGGETRYFGKDLDDAIQNAIVQKYGNQEEYHRRLGELFARTFGLHGFPLLEGHRFDYSLTVPGEIVETNGQLLSGNRVRWQFNTMEAYPLGYLMECRSFLSDHQTQKELLSGLPLDNREALLQFVSIVGDQEKLIEALRECRRNKSMSALYEFRRRASIAVGGHQDVRSVDRLLELCKLPATEVFFEFKLSPH